MSVTEDDLDAMARKLAARLDPIGAMEEMIVRTQQTRARTPTDPAQVQRDEMMAGVLECGMCGRPIRVHPRVWCTLEPIEGRVPAPRTATRGAYRK